MTQIAYIVGQGTLRLRQEGFSEEMPWSRSAEGSRGDQSRAFWTRAGQGIKRGVEAEEVEMQAGDGLLGMGVGSTLEFTLWP